ncbi:AMP-binding protein, partial [Shewanella indica]|uniref:AMP-binding protein n=1 Tax=Shewanella indica TaxID=768528 RepID=UPI00207B3A73
MSLEQYRITHLLRQQLEARAEDIALEGFEIAAPWDKVSWNEFDRISAAIAGILIANGFEVQDRAVILSHNCPQWTCADVGVVRARGVVVPVYPTSTLKQAAYIINDAGAKLLFVDN